MLFFAGPHSFTGDDVVELHCHGGRIVSDALLAAAFALGARPAEPGEFTLRAFLNDKIDLLQAEAIADLVASGSAQAARAAVRSLEGEFSAAVDARAACVDDAARANRGVARLSRGGAAVRRCARVRGGARRDHRASSMRSASARALGRALRDGLSVAIAGAPNAGKSSLLNRLAGYDAAIVTEIPGTTRDPLREHLTLDGLPVTIVDTAGLRETSDPIEREGVRRARLEVARADRLLWVADVREPLAAAIAAARAAVGRRHGADRRRQQDRSGRSRSHASRRSRGHRSSMLSALTGAGIDAAGRALARRRPASAPTAAARSARAAGTWTRSRARARTLVGRATRSCDGALELAAEQLRKAQTALSELTGELTERRSARRDLRDVLHRQVTPTEPTTSPVSQDSANGTHAR